jgi:hypothetical protein
MTANLTSDRLTFVGGMTAEADSRVLGANDRIQPGFIGYGLSGVHHVHDFQEQTDADVVAVSEMHRGRMEQGAAACGSHVAKYRNSDAQIGSVEDFHRPATGALQEFAFSQSLGARGDLPEQELPVPRSCFISE